MSQQADIRAANCRAWYRRQTRRLESIELMALIAPWFLHNRGEAINVGGVFMERIRP